MTNNPLVPPLATMPPLDYLLTCSRKVLQDLELAALARAAQHLKTAKLEWEEAAAQKEISGVVRWLIDCRDTLLEQASRTLEVRLVPEFPNLVEVSGPKRGLDALLGDDDYAVGCS